MEEIKNKKDFYEQTSDKKSLVIFTVRGICPCVSARTTIEDLEKTYSNDVSFYEYKVRKLDKIDDDELLDELCIRPFPTVLYIDDSKVVYRLIGDASREKYIYYLNKLIGG